MALTSRLSYFYEYRYFFWSLVKKEFKVRYTQSILGIGWMVFEPLLLVLTLSTIFTLIGRHGPSGIAFPIFFYAGLLPWNLFKNSLTGGTGAFTGDKGLMSKLPYPREISVFKSWIITFIEFLLASIAFFAILLFFRHPPNLKWFLLPPLIFLQMLFSIGIIFLTASLNVYIRDVSILVKTLSSIWFWFTPIIFDFPYEGRIKVLFYLNPMVGIVKGFRSIILWNEFPRIEYLYSIMICSVLLLIVGYYAFCKLQRNFVDVI